jgi:hypothetical protein
MHTIFWLGNLKGRDHSEDLGINGNISMDVRELRLEVWTGFMWLRIG